MNPSVEISQGRLEGRSSEGVQSFLGIPYAAPPVGPLRFRAPEPPSPWSGVRDAGDFGPSAPQQKLALPLPGMEVGPMDEDCLYLNVYTPTADGGRRPVMVWIHGGAFVIGSGSQPIYGGAALARRGDVVVVTINYRLGPLGFLFLPDLCPGLEGAVGNAGIRDQVAALTWVRENIAAFGGDPENVTIFGESAGGMSVGTLLGCPSARGLFARAIPQSGAAHNVHTRESASAVARGYLEHLGIEPANAARTLRELPPDKLLEGGAQMVLKLGTGPGLLPFQPVVDGDLLPVSPLDTVASGATTGLDLMAGTTRDEWKLFVMMDPGIQKLDEAALARRLEAQVADAAGLVETYRKSRHERGLSVAPRDLLVAIETDRIFRIPAIRLAEAHVASGGRAFMYRFDWESPALGGLLGACHAVEIPFVFGGLGLPGADQFGGRGPEAERLSALCMDAWTAFARSGEPSHPELPGGWTAYEPTRRSTLLLNREVALELDPDGAERRAWEGTL